MNMVPPITHPADASLFFSDLDGALEFYRALFGFELLHREECACALAVPGRQVLTLVHRASPDAPPATPHLCFAVPAAALAAWEARLARFGVSTDSRLHWPQGATSRLHWPQGATSIYFRDPEGHSLELATQRV